MKVVPKSSPTYDVTSTRAGVNINSADDSWSLRVLGGGRVTVTKYGNFMGPAVSFGPGWHDLRVANENIGRDCWFTWRECKSEFSMQVILRI